MNPNECVLCVCVYRFGVIFAYVVEGIDSKVIFVCLINDYSLIADLHIFVYERAECASISLECTKVKLLILNNFAKTDRYLILYTNDKKFIVFKAVSLVFELKQYIFFFFIKNGLYQRLLVGIQNCLLWLNIMIINCKK